MAKEPCSRVRSEVVPPPERGNRISDRVDNPVTQADAERLIDAGNPCTRCDDWTGELPGVMQDHIRAPASHQRLQVAEHGRRQDLAEQVGRVPVEDLIRFEPVVLLVGVALRQPLESHAAINPRVKSSKASGLDAGMKIRAYGYGYLVARTRKCRSQREERLQMAVGRDGSDQCTHVLFLPISTSTRSPDHDNRS